MHHTFCKCKTCAKALSPIDQRVPLLGLASNKLFRACGAVTDHVRSGKTQNVFENRLRVLSNAINRRVHQTRCRHFGRIYNFHLCTEFFRNNFRSFACWEKQNSPCRCFDRTTIEMHGEPAFGFGNFSFFIKALRQRCAHQFLRALYRVGLRNRHFSLGIAQSVAHNNIQLL